MKYGQVVKMNENSELISIIIPCFNSGKTLPRALFSIINQSWKNTEIIIVNDGSTEKETLQVINKFKDIPNILIINQDNLGLPAARNTGAYASKGDYLFFIDADDWLEEDALKLMLDFIKLNKDAAFVYSDIFFSLGRKTAKYLEKYGGETQKILPIGSLAMELNYYKRKDKNNLKKYDLLVFASDHNKMFHSGYDDYYSEYLKHFDWIKKFSLENPKFKIGIKLKHVVKDQIVLKKFEGVDNVKFLVDRKYLSDSYFYAHQAKSICTWSSTLAFEFLGQGRVVYFCDPNFKNVSYLPNDTYIKKFKIETYSKFKKKIYEQIKNKKSRFFKNKKLQEDFCLNSKDVSKNINLSIKRLN